MHSVSLLFIAVFSSSYILFLLFICCELILPFCFSFRGNFYHGYYKKLGCSMASKGNIFYNVISLMLAETYWFLLSFLISQLQILVLLQVLVANDGCQSSVPPFAGRHGLYIEGSVTPPISQVFIQIIAAEDSHVASLRKGEYVLKTHTGEDGSFVAGPLYDDITYDANRVEEF